jgi:hypothetical protein
VFIFIEKKRVIMKKEAHSKEEENKYLQRIGISRRDFLKYSGTTGGALLLGMHGRFAMATAKSQVALAHTNDRKFGVQSSIQALDLNPVKNKHVLIMKPKIYEQEQIARAVELGLGASSPSEIDLIAVNNQSAEYRNRVAEVLKKG